MIDFAITIGLLLAIGALIFINILLLSNLGAYFTKVAQGTTVFINVGDSLRNILPNVTGYRLSRAKDSDGQQWLVPEPDDKRRVESMFADAMPGTKLFQILLWKKFGIVFISWVWPHVAVHRFDIRKGGRRRIEARTHLVVDAPLRSRVVDSEGDTTVDSLLFLVPRPVYLEGIELAGDNSRINLLCLPVFRQVIPSLPVYNLKGDFFTLLDAAVEAAAVDFFARHRVGVDSTGAFQKDFKDDCEGESAITYAHWLKLTKAGEGSPLERNLRRINVSRGYLERLEPELRTYLTDHGLCPVEGADLSTSPELARMVQSGIIPRFGFALVSFRIVEWEAHKSTEPLAAALLSKETEQHAAEGVRQKAMGERDAAVMKAEGDAARYGRPIESLVKQGVTPNVAANVLATQMRTENVRDSKLTTYVEGGASASVLIDGNNQ